MIDPIVHKILAGTIFYGIGLCFFAGAFQLFRKEKKSALFLLSTATIMLVLTLTVRIAQASIR